MFNKIKNGFKNIIEKLNKKSNYNVIYQALDNCFDINIMAEHYETMRRKLNIPEKHYFRHLVFYRIPLLEIDIKLEKRYTNFYNEIILDIFPSDDLGMLRELFIFSNFINRKQMINYLNNFLIRYTEKEDYDNLSLIIRYIDFYFIDYNLQDEFQSYRMLKELIQ